MAHLVVSVIIVHYQNFPRLVECLLSLQQLKISHEIIVVDNDEHKSVAPSLADLFPRVRYYASPGNPGFGAGSNLGARHAVGKFLFFLNPDCRVLPDAIEKLVNFLVSHNQVAIAAPLLLDSNSVPYPHVGTKCELTPQTALVALSLINKLWPTNPVSRNYWVFTKNLHQPIKIAVAPGTAFLIYKSVFKKIGGFDTNFFLYFEEFDLCLRLSALGKHIYLIPKAQVIHHWGKSTTASPRINRIFRRSRFYYFQKHYGILTASLVSILISQISFHTLFLLIVLTLGALIIYIL